MDPDHQLLPTCMALHLWSAFARTHWLQAKAPDSVRVFATADTDLKNITCFLIPRGAQAESLLFQPKLAPQARWTLRHWRGSSGDDPAPVLEKEPRSWDPRQPLTLPPFTITILQGITP
ncbi:MAG: hypothetical protein HC904_13970 [Blastochloris sp.]|nr:hypothetical protein [Blastochloris sp.]